MARKVIIDCDPGIDDAVALCMAFFEARLEVLAVTAVEGNVSADQASVNVQTVIDQLDPPRLPRVGAALPTKSTVDVDLRYLHGDDGLGNALFNVSQLHHKHTSAKLICDEVRAAPDQVTIVCLGPLTNVAAAFQRDPEILTMIDQLILSGGSINCVGNVTAAAEFNMYFDPVSARTVLLSPVTKTMIPLDVSSRVSMTLNMVDQLPSEECRAGRFLGKTLPFAFRAYRQHLGKESIFLPDVVALVAAIHPELFETSEMHGDVETTGELTRGVTVLDRRSHPAERPNMAVASAVDVAAVKDCILRGIAEAGRRTSDA